MGPGSDVYALGAILYEAVTGRAPFTGETVAVVLRQVIESDPAPPRRWNPNVPADLETICLKCLEKRPERRYPSARALAEELDRFLNFEPILGRPAGRLRKTWSWSQQNPWVLAAGCGLLVLVLAGVADALWEKSRFLAWQLQAGKNASPPHNESPALLFLKLFPVLCYLLYFAGNSFRRLYRRRVEKGEPLPGLRLLCQAGLGAAGTAAGIGYLLLQIRSWIWSTSPRHILILELLGTACALVLDWMGLRMVWEAVGLHETSRFGGVVDKSLERQLAAEARRWSVFKLLGFALWVLLLLVVWGLSLGFLNLIFYARGLDGIIYLAGVCVSVAVGALLAWVIRKRLRLFTFVFVPLTLALFGFALGIVVAGTIVVARLCWAFFFLSTFLTLSGLHFFQGRNRSPAGPGRRFPGNLWVDALGGLAFFMAVFFLIQGVENWRGRRAWSRVKADLAAKGQSLDYVSFLKPAVPDAENVMAHPYMKQHFLRGGRNLPISPPPSSQPVQNTPFSLVDLQTFPRISPVAREGVGPTSLRDILDWYARYRDEFAQMEDALQRPQARLTGYPRNLVERRMLNPTSFGLAAQAYANLGKVHLIMGDTDSALKDLRMFRRLIIAAQANEPLRISADTLEVWLARPYAETVEQMLAAGLWPASLLDQVQRLCDGPDLFSSVAHSLAAQPAGTIQWLRDVVEQDRARLFRIPRPIVALFPDGWFYQNYAIMARFSHLYLEGVDAPGQRLNARMIEAVREQLAGQLREGPPRLGRMPVLFLFMPDVVAELQYAAHTQTLLNEAFLACAMERHRAAYGSYPETLDALVPQFAARVPHDLFDGQPLRYRRTDAGKYLLYSIGWNSKDDQGRMPVNSQRRGEWQNVEGDWVWQGVPNR